MSLTDPHRECWELLPWLANERLSEEDFTRIDKHLRSCSQCQAELQEQRLLREAVRSAEAIVLAPQNSLQKLMQRIDGEDSDTAREGRDGNTSNDAPALSSKKLSAPLFGAPRWLAIAAAFQAVAIAALFGVLRWQDSASLTAPRFTTLTSQATAVPHGPVIRVVFAEDTALADVGELLRSLQAQIVAGPSEAGVYTLTLTSSDGQTADIGAAVRRLRADKRVRFSEPAVAEVAPP